MYERMQKDQSPKSLHPQNPTTVTNPHE